MTIPTTRSRLMRVLPFGRVATRHPVEASDR